MSTLLIPILLAAPAQALDLSYDEALNLAVAHNLGLEGTRQDLAAAKGAVTSARSAFDPTLTGDVGRSASFDRSFTQFGLFDSEVGAVTWGAGVSERLPTGTALSLDYSARQSDVSYSGEVSGVPIEVTNDQSSSRLAATIAQSLLEGHRMSYNMKAVRQAVAARDAADLTVAAERQQVMADAASAYWAVWYTGRLVEIADQTLAVAQEEQRVVDLRVQQGDLAPVEASRVAAAVVQARSAQVEARNSAAAARDAMLVLLGQPPGSTLQLTSAPLDPVDVSLDADAVVEAALAGNPTLQVARLSEQQAAEGLSDARHARLPELTATGTYGVSGYSDSETSEVYGLFDGTLRDWYVGAELSVPLGNRYARGQVVAAGADAASARLDREALELAVAQSVRAQVRTLESSRTKLDLAEANLRLAEQTLAAEQALREAGRGIQKDVLDALKNVDTAGVELEKARADYQFAIVELARLKGEL